MTHTPMPIRFGRRHKHALYAAFYLAWGSGALWLLFHYFLRVEGEFGDSAHPMEIASLRLHGLAAFASLVAMGSVLPVHAKRAWELRRNRHTGVAMKASIAWLAASGYALYYFAPETHEAWLPVAHWATGLALPLAIAVHVSRGRRRAAPRPQALRRA